MKLFHGHIKNNQVDILEEEQHHILKVLRMKDGDPISITDGHGNLATGFLYTEGKKAMIDISKIQRDHPPFAPHLHIAIAPTKNIDRTEFFVEKATEMGVSEISFLLTEKSERKHLNIDKLRKKAIAASKQSLRFHFPVLNDLEKFGDFISKISPENTYIAHCDPKFERFSIHDIPLHSHLTFLVGPEGDFSPNEINQLSQLGIKAVQLGQQRLRTETAGIFIAAWNYLRM